MGESKTKAELISEIKKLRQRIAELEKREIEYEQIETKLRESEEKYRTLTESSLTGIFIHQDGKYIFVNDKFAEIHGYKPEELIGKDPLILIHPDDRKTLKQVSLKRQKGRVVSQRYEIRKIRKDGKTIWCETIATLIRYKGRPAIMGNVIDITQRKQVEENLRESEEIFKSISASAQDGIIMIDNGGNILYWNKAAQRIFGYTEKEAIGKEMHIFLVPEKYHKAYRKGFSKFKKTGHGPVIGKTLELSAIRKDGVKFPIELSVSAMRIRGKWHSIGIVRDITQRKQAEERIKHLNAVLRAIRNVSQLVTTEKDPDRLLKGACESLIGTRGYHSAWIVLWDETGKLVTAAEAGIGEDFSKIIESLKNGKLPICGEKALFQSDIVVTSNPFSICTNCPLAGKYKGRSAMTVRLEHGEKIYGMLTVSIPRELARDKEEQKLFKELAEDLTFALYSIELKEERKQVEEEIRKERDRLQKYLDVAGVIIVTLNKQGEITLINRKGCEILGYPKRALIGKNWFDTCIPERYRSKIREVFQQTIAGNLQASEYYENPVLTRSGEERTIAWHNAILTDKSGNAIGTLSSGEDITQRKQAEEQIKAALKEKEVLLREIHHRVKNNMQIVSSLLRLQSRYTKDKQILDIFKASQSRIESMAFIHEKLYQSKDLTRIDFTDYVNTLVRNLFTTYGVSTARIKLNID
ncbi:MAG TPA: PAS domain S-box protein, partial [Candidatus Desulfofervidus auxilii]|nr:PAS domain S-box protein [Candidatus Desulfofervidus auxilii]